MRKIPQMTLFNYKRLKQTDIQLDLDGLRRGSYSDKYFHNVAVVLQSAAEQGYRFAGTSPRLFQQPVNLDTGNLTVEAQIFMRRAPEALIAGTDVALVMLRHATGFFENEQFVDTSTLAEVEAIQDGTIVPYNGHADQVLPVIKIRGRYRDFAQLETPMLGYLSRMSRIASNSLGALRAANGKPVLFFPARFDLPEVQSADGYAYWVAVQRFNFESGMNLAAAVSTDRQGAWWGGKGGGTVPHALISVFLGDTAESMLAYARYLPVSIPRIALVDFNNDVIGDSLRTLEAFWQQYINALAAGDIEEQPRWQLHGVRVDTSPDLRDVSLAPDEPMGISVLLIQRLREALDSAWQTWDVPDDLRENAAAYCRSVKIVASGGFNRDRILEYETRNAPVDIYGVGSTFFRNDSATNIDFTLDLVRVQLHGQWHDLAKIGRQPNANPDLKLVDLSEL